MAMLKELEMKLPECDVFDDSCHRKRLGEQLFVLN